MSIALLDANVLIALAWPDHAHHEFAHAWFSENRHHGWATCQLTQAAFVRLSATPAVVKTLIPPHEALRVLEMSLQAPEHVYWPDEMGMTAILPAIRQRMIGPKQVNDAILLDLAIRREGRLVTFDARLPSLLSKDHPKRDTIHLIPVA